MKLKSVRVMVAVMAMSAIASGLAAIAARSAKLPKCAAVKCRDIGCPSDVLCVAGGSVKTCADVCNGH
jgi:hypothetical protein